MMENGLALRPTPGRRTRMIDHIDAPSLAVDEIMLSQGMEWFTTLMGKIPTGANLLLSGDPGVGKSTLALQVAASAAALGQRVLYLTTEQRADTVRQRFAQICNATRAAKFLNFKDDLYDISLIPQLLANQLLRPGADPVSYTHLTLPTNREV